MENNLMILKLDRASVRNITTTLNAMRREYRGRVNSLEINGTLYII